MPEASLDTWTVLFLVAAMQGFFLAIVLLLNKKGNFRANVLLSAVMALFGFTLVHYVAYWTNYQFEFPHLLGASSTIPFLIGPLLYLYVRTLFKRDKLAKADALHTIPWAIHFALLAPFYFQGGVAKIEQALGGEGWLGDVMPWVQIAHMLTYAVLMHLQVRGGKSEETPKEVRRWVNVLVGLFAVFALAFTSYYVLVRFPFFSVEWDYMISWAMALSIYTVGFMGYRQPIVLTGIQTPETAEKSPKYKRSGLTEGASQELLASLQQLMASEKLYLDNQLKLPTLADRLGTTTHHLSQVINASMQCNFAEMLSRYRVAEAKRLMELDAYSNTPVIQIAYEVGFNNKTSFNNAFKKVEGVSPGQFKKAVSSNVGV